MKIAGFCSGHDCSYAILEDGIPIVHNELERFTREKEPLGDSIKFMFETYDDCDDIKHFTHCLDTWKGGIVKRYPDTFNKMTELVDKNGGNYYIPGHHQSHAANAFFSSNFDEALIITIDGGGRDYDENGEEMITTFTVWTGKDNKINEIEIIPHGELNIGSMWSNCTKEIFGLSNGYPYGNQAGTVMAMACMGNSKKYFNDFYNTGLKPGNYNWDKARQLSEDNEQDRFDLAAGLQKATEVIIKDKFDKYMEKYPYKHLCLSGGVVLNSVMVGKLYEWYPHLEDIYICPVPYDAGLAIGSAQYVYHQILDYPRIKWEDNAKPYLGYTYDKDAIQEQLDINKDKIIYREVTDDDVVELLSKNDNVISVFHGGSESGRRALGNRSILADPRSPDMKDIINEKVKHRQWFRPFAPSILREDVKDWFEHDVNSPYMTTVLKFKEEIRDKVPAVVHLDGTGRLQTVTEKDNKWYYNFISKFKEKTGVPIVLNTSFNDREPIVETPEHAINCYLGTDIDYLYFCDVNILVNKKEIENDNN